MNILCYWLGHKSLEHTFDGGEYMRVRRGAVDGTGRQHATLFARCPRCGKEYRAGAVHFPPAAEQRQTAKEQRASKPFNNQTAFSSQRTEFLASLGAYVQNYGDEHDQNWYLFEAKGQWVQLNAHSYEGAVYEACELLA